MHEVLRSGDVRDPRVPEADQVLDGGTDAGCVVDAQRGLAGAWLLVEVGSDDDRGQAQLLEQGGPLVVDLQVGDEHAVDPALLDQPAVRRMVVALGHLQQQCVSPGRQHRLEAGDERGEERVGAEDLGRAGDHQADGQRLGHRQGASTGAGRPAQVSAASRIRRRVSGEMPGRPFRAKETAPLETPAAVATSLIVGRPMDSTKPV